MSLWKIFSNYCTCNNLAIWYDDYISHRRMLTQYPYMSMIIFCVCYFVIACFYYLLMINCFTFGVCDVLLWVKSIRHLLLLLLLFTRCEPEYNKQDDKDDDLLFYYCLIRFNDDDFSTTYLCTYISNPSNFNKTSQDCFCRYNFCS